MQLLDNRTLEREGRRQGRGLGHRGAARCKAANLVADPDRRFRAAARSATSSSRSAIRSASAHTVTSGIVSALGRSRHQSRGLRGLHPDRRVDQSRAIPAARSSTSAGELVGINSAILSRTGGNIGIGFAIPSNMMKTRSWTSSIKYGSVEPRRARREHPDADARYRSDLRPARQLGRAGRKYRPNSGAERAGIQVGDVIVSVNEHSVRDSGSLKAAIGLLRPGEKVVVGVIRDGHPLKVNAVLGEAPRPPAARGPARHRAARSGLRRRRALDNDAELPGLVDAGRCRAARPRNAACARATSSRR